MGPAHPGRFLNHGINEPHGLSVTHAARVFGVTRFADYSQPKATFVPLV